MNPENRIVLQGNKKTRCFSLMHFLIIPEREHTVLRRVYLVVFILGLPQVRALPVD